MGSFNRPTTTAIRLRLGVGFMFLMCLNDATMGAEATRTTVVDGFTEPYRTINVAAPETGIITDLNVHEGDRVEAKQILATLDNDVHLALLAIAKQSMEAKGRLEAAQADVKLHQNRFDKFQQLRLSGHARQEEVNRAQMELAVAQSREKSAQEDLLIKQLEYDKINVQLERRKIRSPIAGFVTFLHKQKGEFVAPNKPDVVTIVELDRLVAVFSVMSRQAKQLSVEKTVTIRFPESRKHSEGTIEFISPVMDAESGTVRVKVRIENPTGKFKSGDRCVMSFADAKTQ